MAPAERAGGRAFPFAFAGAPAYSPTISVTS